MRTVTGTGWCMVIGDPDPYDWCVVDMSIKPGVVVAYGHARSDAQARIAALTAAHKVYPTFDLPALIAQCS
jgi:hypothetical protein